MKRTVLAGVIYLALFVSLLLIGSSSADTDAVKTPATQPGVKPDPNQKTPRLDPVVVDQKVALLGQLKANDSIYKSGFTISGTHVRGGFKKKWKFTTSTKKRALEEEVIEILALKGKGRFVSLRRAWLIGPKSQATYNFVGRFAGRIYELGKLPPRPKGSPGLATSAFLDIEDADVPAYQLPIMTTLWSLGRGYSDYITEITNVTRLDNGLLSITAKGTDINFRPRARWELVIDPGAAYMVREAKLYARETDTKSLILVTNSGTKWIGSRCIPEQTQLWLPFAGRGTIEYLSETASNRTDKAFIEHVEATIRGPYFVHTDVADKRFSPERHHGFKAGQAYDDVFVMMGKTLDGKSLEEFDLELDDNQLKGKMILLCFFDMQQRPSRNCVRELASMADSLTKKEVIVVSVDASTVEAEKLKAWLEESKIELPVGQISADAVQKTLAAWAVRNLPWLILTDEKQVIRAEGFTLTELDEKLNEVRR